MLENTVNIEGNSDELKKLSKELALKLSKTQQTLREKKLPVIILVDGLSAAGKGTLITEVIKLLDPRFFKVYSIRPRTEEEKRYPMMKRYWDILPEYGKIAVLDRSWYKELVSIRQDDNCDEKEYLTAIKNVVTFERQLTDDGYLIIKLFLHISQKEQKRRLEKLDKDPDNSWRVDKDDFKKNKNYDKFYRIYDEMLELTSKPYCPWNVINADAKVNTRAAALTVINEVIEKALENPPCNCPEPNDKFTYEKVPKLSETLKTPKALTREEYDAKLKACRKELSSLHSILYKKKIPAIFLFEGWDAAGKGGAIKRVSYALDPRGYEAVPVAAPTPDEKNRHYLWRFWRSLPKSGHIAIFDRSWYGRVMVERLENFTPENRWQAAYREINEFERELTHEGFIILKFWINIDKDEQLKRFNERMNTPEKRWKITDEDWRNREKWDAYEIAIDEMTEKTSTKDAPWHIIEGNDKHYARISVMETIIDALKKRLD